jgi:hypothetical protein
VVRRNPLARLRELQTGNHEKLELVGHSQMRPDGIDPYEFEHELQRSLRGHRTVGEGFKRHFQKCTGFGGWYGQRRRARR